MNAPAVPSAVAWRHRRGWTRSEAGDNVTGSFRELLENKVRPLIEASLNEREPALA